MKHGSRGPSVPQRNRAVCLGGNARTSLIRNGRAAVPGVEPDVWEREEEIPEKPRNLGFSEFSRRRGVVPRRLAKELAPLNGLGCESGGELAARMHLKGIVRLTKT